jgi:hypothetical protein
MSLGNLVIKVGVSDTEERICVTRRADAKGRADGVPGIAGGMRGVFEEVGRGGEGNYVRALCDLLNHRIPKPPALAG